MCSNSFKGVQMSEFVWIRELSNSLSIKIDIL